MLLFGSVKVNRQRYKVLLGMLLIFYELLVVRTHKEALSKCRMLRERIKS